MMKYMSLAAGALCLAACASVKEPTLDSAEAFMWAYTEAWNAHDTEALGRDFWQMTGSVEEETARLEAIFAQLEAEGYDRSTIHEVFVCMAGENVALADMRFTRYLTSGEVMGPDLRGSKYLLEWEDGKGWRITQMLPAVAQEPVGCDLTLMPPLSGDQE